MSDKVQLPDELLDMISGGVVTINGETLDNITSDNDGYYITTKQGGEYQYLFTDEDKAKGLSAPLSRGMFMADVFEKRDADETFALNADMFTKV